MAEAFPPSMAHVRQRLSLHWYAPDTGVMVVTAAGEIDLANRAALTSELSTASASPDLRLLVCDLTKVTFLACTGVAALVELWSELDSRGVLLRVVATNSIVLRALDATGQRENLGVCPNLTTALRRDPDLSRNRPHRSINVNSLHSCCHDC